MSTTDVPVSFEVNVKPLFRERDREAMKSAFDLWSYDDVVRHSAAIATKLREGSMPCDGAWPEEQIAIFESWVDAGMPA